MRAKLFVIYLVYGREHLESGRLVLNRFTERLFPGAERTLIVVDNKWSSDADWIRHSSYIVLPGDNSNREFSGWDVGYRKMLTEMNASDDDIVVLANDTFHRNYGSAYLNDFLRSEVSTALKHEKLVGYHDAFPAAITTYGLPLAAWIRSSLVIGRVKTLNRLFPFSLPIEDSQVFSGDRATFFCEPSPLSQNYRTYLKTWLFSEAGTSDFNENWHSGAALTNENIRSFEGKTRAILSEQLLSARAKAYGIELFDTRPSFRRRVRRLLDGLMRF